jgi:hypothetical protein
MGSSDVCLPYSRITVSNYDRKLSYKKACPPYHTTNNNNNNNNNNNESMNDTLSKTFPTLGCAIIQAIPYDNANDVDDELHG